MKKAFQILGVTFVIVTLVSVKPSHAQSAEAEVRAAIDHLFDGMRAGDSTMVRSVLHEDAMMTRVGPQGLNFGSIDGFVEAVGAPHDEVWDERIWDVHIFVDGRLASAWMEFAFFLGDTMSHCGVNSMQLYQEDNGWKIIYLADTNRPPTCEPSNEGS
ncbi:MAG: nuclear transport factor 2 family protein [Bacteroidetes bacterium]|nr:nuclear transport factor 2 family protein [Bacteroidota bacterium]MCY4205818.1 nuclear transport factor 2 family protein [Bacteroidota bacterium]